MNYEKNLRMGRHIKMYDCVENNRHGAGTKLLELPKGIMNQNELVSDAARRELLEETGYM